MGARGKLCRGAFSTGPTSSRIDARSSKMARVCGSKAYSQTQSSLRPASLRSALFKREIELYVMTVDGGAACDGSYDGRHVRLVSSNDLSCH